MNRALPVQKVMRLFDEGRADRDKEVTTDRYPRRSVEWRWWVDGWLDRDKELKRRKR